MSYEYHVTQMDNQETSEDDPHSMAALIKTALYDSSGEMVEGAFVDRWESYAANAIDELAEIFRTHGYTEREAQIFRAIMRDPEPPVDAVVALIQGLAKFTRPLIVEMRRDPNPRARLVAKRVGAQLFDPVFWLESLDDPDPEVRASAVNSIAQNRRIVSGAEEYLIRALNDDDPRVRKLAGETVTFYKQPAGGEALVRRLEAETSKNVRKAILAAIAREVRRLGVHLDHTAVAEGIGPAIKRLLLTELNHPDAEIRQLVASALERLRGEDVATAMLDQLLIEREPSVRCTLMLFNGFSTITARSFPILVSMLTSDPDATVRLRIAWLMESFGPAAISLLITALDDAEGPRRPAAVTLGKIGNLSALPALARELANPANRNFQREIADAIRYILLAATHANAPSAPITPSPELSALIQQWIDGVRADSFGSWPLRVLKEHNALVLHSTIIYMWGLQPDGHIVCLDHEAFSQPVDPEDDPLTRFAAIVHGARRHPELCALVPVPPKGTAPCLSCNTLGYPQDAAGGNWCMSCNGLGWVIR